jgi:hypothetical protein
MPEIINTQIDKLTEQAFQALVSKGIYALLFATKYDTASKKIVADTSKNILYGYKVGGFNTSGDSADSEEFQDQLSGGFFKSFIGGAIDGGDFSFNSYFAPDKPKPKITGIVRSTVITPQFILILAIEHEDEDKLQGFFASGINYLGGNDIKGDLGKAIGSSMKFKISGKPLWGFGDPDAVKENDESDADFAERKGVGVLQKSLYEAGKPATTGNGGFALNNLLKNVQTQEMTTA